VAKLICHTPFRTFLGAPDPENFWMHRDYTAGSGPSTSQATSPRLDGEVLGSNFATRWGSVGFFGPITIRPDLWNSGLGQRLAGAACDAFAAWEIRQAGLFTFADSAKHVWTDGKFGFHPSFLTAIMKAPVRAGSGAGWSRYSDLPEGQQDAAQAAIPSTPSTSIAVGMPITGHPRTEPDVRHCRVAQPLLAFAPTDPTVRRYRSGLFRKDLRRVDHLCQACWITGSGNGKAVRSRL
jgi:hypothetical protein